MPLRGAGHSGLVGDEAPFFGSLVELDAWFMQPHSKLTGVLGYQPRPHVDGQSDSRGKLLVCHDYKGGYTETPSGLCYTFNFWSLCDTFVYFSHHRITIPPSGWTNAAHRQGVKMLGTLIFEHTESDPDGFRILLGNIPRSSTSRCEASGSIPLSKHYASRLAELAFQRGFDGYLLNFESNLPCQSDQARALAAWTVLLRAELRTKVGPHASVVWYDSVTISGKVKYQNRLDNYNLPFFIASDALFTNYFWRPSYPSLVSAYFLSIDPALLRDCPAAGGSPPDVKTMQTIFTGIDVWGRSQYGGGGFNTYRALTHIAPQSLGLSAALFGQAWSWESEQDKPGWNWEQWWDYERKLWIGPPQPGEVVPVPDPPQQPDGMPDYNEGPFKPISAFFADAPPPDPLHFAFCTSFCPGVGRSWFVNGENVLQTEHSWTDIDKQCSIGNLVWPRPILQWEFEERKEEDLPTASTAFDMTDGWNGGNALNLSITRGGSKAEDAAFCSIWLPVQSLTVTAQKSYEVRIVYKTKAGEDVDLDLGVNVKPLSTAAELTVDAPTVTDLPHGWSQQVSRFTPTSPSGSVSVAVGLIISFVAQDPSLPCNFTVSLGQLAVYPSSPLPPASIGTPFIIWAHFAAESTVGRLANLAGTLTWGTALSFPLISPIELSTRDREDPRPAWILEDGLPQSLTFMYFNIYIVPHSSDVGVLDPSSAMFIGTTGLDGRANRFYVEPQCLPQWLEQETGVRFYVQGVTNHGEVVPWERCVFTDYSIGSK